MFRGKKACGIQLSETHIWPIEAITRLANNQEYNPVGKRKTNKWSVKPRQVMELLEYVKGIVLEINLFKIASKNI